jgi:hypothetical protein
MARYLISFDHGAMDHVPDEEGPAVREASLAVIRDAKDAGVWRQRSWEASRPGRRSRARR